MSLLRKNVCVVVLGDIGRSPRMQYHSLSLAENGHVVDIVGYGDSQPMDQLKLSRSIYYHYLCPIPHIPLKLANYIFKTIFQALNLIFLLFTMRKPDVVLVQNPPAIPSLIVCWLFCRIIHAKLIIDWHNYAYTIMGLNLNKTHPLVKITKKVEAFIGYRADHNFCVTGAMKKDLKDNWNIQATTLHDKPPEIFKPITLKEKHDFLLNLGIQYTQVLSDSESSVFTKVEGGQVRLRENRPGLLVSSTSWTEDEDFSVLFSALQEYEQHHTNGNLRKLPDLICIITGKGHLKEYYCQKIKQQNWNHVIVITPWLESSEYPLVLGSADLGVCLHTSSSGLDLPMKVVDMFGCCLPVLAYDYNCLNELVINGKNSLTFNSSEDLSSKLLSWFENFPYNEEQQKIEKSFRDELEVFQNVRWRENWTSHALSAFS